MPKRSFEELSVVTTGVQSLEDRFGKRRRHEYDDLPPISQWRCNLTGLSQEHNLYFIAYGKDVHVHVPQFPTQSITREPVLIVPSHPSRPGLAGHLDPQNPHTINNLIVHHLGNDEVIAVVRDDGDVEAVLVRHVVQAIQRRAEPHNTIGVEADEVKPIFQSNVGISAWGLAIHRNARILATSSNAHEVRVFKFGLLPEVDESPEPTAEADWVCNAGGDEEMPDVDAMRNVPTGVNTHRRMDVTQRVLNGDANIPYISFCNTGDDPDARWLLTTDISGYCRVMDLHRTDAEPTVQQFRFGRSFMSHGGGFDRLNAGWAIMFLDRRSFQPERSLHAALGLADERDSLPGAKGSSSRTWDLSDTIDHVPNNSPAFTYNDPRRHREAESAINRHATQNSTPRVPNERPAEMSGEPEGTEPDPQAQQNVIETILEELTNQVADQLVEDPDAIPVAPDSDSEEEYTSEDSALIYDNDDPEDEGTEDSISFNSIYGGKRIFGNQPYFYHQGGLCDDLPCPILHASVKNIYLLQPSNQSRSAGPSSPPMVGIANPLRQAIQSHFGYLNMFDRLNMNAYIPSLGVVVLASQKGRAVVLSLTKLPASANYPAEIREGLGPPKTNHAMRVECILPLAHQELENQRPFAPLHGIATAPIQGVGGLAEDRKRWRLMMMYQDHSIFSYELKRRRVRDSAVEVSGLVV